jgi:adenylosuccinate lyase
MDQEALTAISPLDGRYSAKCTELRGIFSEFGLIRRRVLAEVHWLRCLAGEASIPEAGSLSATMNARLDELTADFEPAFARRIKEIERQTNHDVKAVEYFIAERLAAEPDAGRIRPFIHFGCTSEDINNVAYALMLRDGRDQLLAPLIAKLIATLDAMALELADVAMLARTHGQPASPTTLGKEMANISWRLKRQLAGFRAVSPLAKFNGAVGNYNAHHVAFPATDWPALSRRYVESLGLEWNPCTTQIEPHDWIAEYCDSLARLNTVLLDAARDFWG